MARWFYNSPFECCAESEVKVAHLSGRWTIRWGGYRSKVSPSHDSAAPCFSYLVSGTVPDNIHVASRWVSGETFRRLICFQGPVKHKGRGVACLWPERN